MARGKGRKSKVWSNYGDGVQVVDITHEVSILDQIRLTEGKDNDKYKKQHEKTVKLIRLYNSELGGRGKFGMSISKARGILQYSGEPKTTVQENTNG